MKNWELIPLSTRFYGFIKISNGIECWEWLGSKLPKGYGRIAAGHKTIFAHRVSWELHNGYIPTGLDVLHHCDNPSCVNPEHLFLGTSLDNKIDSVKKRRHAHGSSQGSAKLSEDIVRLIKTEKDKTVKYWTDLLEVHKSTILRTKSGKRWRHVNV